MSKLFSCFIVFVLWRCTERCPPGSPCAPSSAGTILFVAENESLDTVVFSYYWAAYALPKRTLYDWLGDDTIVSGTKDTFSIMDDTYYPRHFPDVEGHGFYLHGYNAPRADSIQVQFLPSKRCVGHSYRTSTAPRGLYNSTSYNRVLDDQRRITTFIYTFTAQDIKTAAVCQ